MSLHPHAGAPQGNRRRGSRCFLAGLAACLAVACGGADVEGLGPGRMDGRTYVHDRFGLRLTVPEEWFILSTPEDEKRVAQAGRERLSGGDPTGDAYRSAGPTTARNLLTVYRHPIGTGHPGFNPNLILGVENVLARPRIQTAVDYLEMMRDFLTRGGTPMAFEPIAADSSLGGQSFAVLGATIQLGETPIGQVYFCRRIEPYMLTLVASFTTAEEWAELETVLSTLNLEL